jgi:hypothetical protein
MDKWRTTLTQVHCISRSIPLLSDDEGGNNDDDLLHENTQNQAYQSGGEFLS